MARGVQSRAIGTDFWFWAADGINGREPWIGFPLFGQWIGLDVGGPLLGVAVMSDGLRMVLGN